MDLEQLAGVMCIGDVAGIKTTRIVLSLCFALFVYACVYMPVLKCKYFTFSSFHFTKLYSLYYS